MIHCNISIVMIHCIIIMVMTHCLIIIGRIVMYCIIIIVLHPYARFKQYHDALHHSFFVRSARVTLLC